MFPLIGIMIYLGVGFDYCWKIQEQILGGKNDLINTNTTTTTTTDLIDEKKELFKVNYAHSFSLCEHLYTWISIGTSIIFLTVLYNSMSCAGVSREIISE